MRVRVRVIIISTPPGPVGIGWGAGRTVPPSAHPDHSTLHVLLEGRADPNLYRVDGLTALTGNVALQTTNKLTVSIEKSK